VTVNAAAIVPAVVAVAIATVVVPQKRKGLVLNF